MDAPTEIAAFSRAARTWHLDDGNPPRARESEVAAVARALEIGYRLFDTAELYAEGGAERILGEALSAFGSTRRSELCIVSKVLPQNASRHGTVSACEASIERIGCEYLDLYLLHWKGSQRFTDTLRAFEELLRRGLIRHFGVSNFGVEDLSQWLEEEKALGLAGRTQCNQLHYSLDTRGIEAAVIPWQRKHTHPDDGVFAARPGRPHSPRNIAAARARARRNAGAAGTGLVSAAPGRGGHSQIRSCRADR